MLNLLSPAFRCGLGIFVLSSSMAYSAATADVQVRISDPATSPRTPIASMDDIANEAFRGFVTGAIPQITGAFDTAETIDIWLTRIPFSAPARFEVAAPVIGAQAGCALRSPWADIDLYPEEARVEARLYWNERQIVLDLDEDGSRHHPAPRQPYDQAAFERYAQQYGAAMTRGQSVAEMRDGLPPDVGLLFARVPKSTLMPFAAGTRRAMSQIALERAAAQVALIGRLAAVCATLRTGDHHFSHISEVPR